jgi:hypothetical protein
MLCRIRKIVDTGVLFWSLNMSQNGKGDKRRPKSIDYKTWEKNYEKIFRKKSNVNTKEK